MVRSGWMLATLAALAVACGDGGREGPDRPAACTGPVPDHATPCSGPAPGAETPRTVVASCAGAGACTYTCAVGFDPSDGVCVAVAGRCTGAVPEHATLCPGSDQGLDADMPRVLRPVCDAACAYTCAEGYVLLTDSCAPEGSPDDVQLTDNGDGTVTVVDSHATLIWLKDADCLEPLAGVARPVGGVPYVEALTWTGELGAGACGLTDGTQPGDWRLPDDSELQLLAADLAVAGTAGWETFDGVQLRAYWSTFSTCTGIYGVVEIQTGLYEDVDWVEPYNVWPVRTPAP